MKVRPTHTYAIGARRCKPALARAALACIAAGVMVSACTPIRDYRGFVPQEDTIEQVRVGMSRTQVEQVLGTPSSQSAIGGTRYYYISSTFETVAFFEPEEIDRKVYEVEFDATDSVQRLAYYGMQDGKVFDFISRTTPTRGKQVSLMQEFFGNVGRFSNSKSVLRNTIEQNQR